MPPKKKGGKKGKKGGKKSGKDDDGSTAGERAGSGKGKELNELSKEFFLIQVKDLEQRLSRYQAKCDALGASNAEYDERHKQLQQDRKEIVEFLKKSLEQRQDDIADLNDRLLGLQQAKDSEKESYENQLSQLKREFQEVRDQLTSENMILGGKLASLEEFKVQKEDLMKKFEDMEGRLAQQEKDHEEKIYNLERNAVVNKDRLKKEMVLRVNTVAAEFRKVSNKQMADTTKRNIRENVSINAQLAKMSEKTKELVQENDELREKEKQQKMQIELLEACKEDLAKKNHSNLKVLKMITARARQQEMTLEDYEARDQEYGQLEEESTHIRHENDELTAKLDSMEDELQQTKETLKATEKERREFREGKERLEDILTAAAITLQQVSIETDEDEIDRKVKRQTMIERLLLVLNSAALLGKAPPPAEFFQQPAKTLMAPLSIVKDAQKPVQGRVGSGGAAGRGTTTGKEMPHYNLGDLGLVPRPRKSSTNRQAHFGSKVAHLSHTTRVGVNPSTGISALGKLTPNSLQKLDKLPAIVYQQQQRKAAV